MEKILSKIVSNFSPSFRSATGGSFLVWCIASIILYNNRSYGYKRKPFQKLFQIKIWFMVISLYLRGRFNIRRPSNIKGEPNSLEISQSLKISKDRHSPFNHRLCFVGRIYLYLSTFIRYRFSKVINFCKPDIF